MGERPAAPPVATTEAERRLKAKLDRYVVALAGTGIAAGATGRDPVTSWGGLLESGVRHCERLVADLPAGWGDAMRQKIRENNADALIEAAGEVTARLGGRGGEEYQKWLTMTFEGLEPKSKEAIEALKGLDVPIFTTNYDGLIEKVTGWKPVTWRDKTAMAQVIRGDEKEAVLHVHGYWEDPESVVLDHGSYSEVLDDESFQRVLRSLATVHSFLLVGVGNAVADPHFRALWQWLDETLPPAAFENFWLRSRKELDDETAPIPRGIVAVAYGPDHSRLPPYLRDLAAKRRHLVDSARAAIGNVGDDALRAAVEASIVARRLDDELLGALLEERATVPPLEALATALGGYVVMDRHGDEAEIRWESEYVRRELDRELAAADPGRYRTLHERAADHYGSRLKTGLDDRSYGEWYDRFEEKKWTRDARDFVYHLAHLDVVRARLQIARLFLEAFWWWGCYREFAFCSELLDDAEQLARPQTDDEQWLGLLRTVLAKYPTGYRKPPGAHWETVEAALRSLRASLGLDGPPSAADEDRHRTRAFISVFLAHAHRFQAPLDDRADAEYADAAALFAEDGDRWSEAWIAFEEADLALERRRPDAARAGCENAASIVRELIAAGDEPDRELMANIERARADAAWLEGRTGDAFDRYAGAVLHAYLFQRTSHPPDPYTQAFYGEMLERLTERLFELSRGRRRADALAACARLRDSLPLPDVDAPDSIEAALDAGNGPELALHLFPAPPTDAELGKTSSAFLKRWRKVEKALEREAERSL